MSDTETRTKRTPILDLPPACCEHCNKPISFQPLVEQAISLAKLGDKSAQTLRLMLKGLPAREIAEVTGTREKTVKSHIGAIFQRFGVDGRTELFHLLFPS